MKLNEQGLSLPAPISLSSSPCARGVGFVFSFLSFFFFVLESSYLSLFHKVTYRLIVFFLANAENLVIWNP